MLSVTVMMFKDIVESVTLLKDDAWKGNPRKKKENRCKNISVIKSEVYQKQKSRTECQYPLQTGRALFPAPPVPFQQPGGCALLCCTAEPGNQKP